MLPYFAEEFANPASSIHRPGRTAAHAVEEAREQVASLVVARPGEIIFTSGATESNNLAILGIAGGSCGGRRRLVTTAVEHKSVLGPVEALRKRGFEAVVLPVDREGTVQLDVAEEAVTEDTLLVSIQAANNEVGTIQPVGEIARLAHGKGALVHCDAAQAVGKIPVDVRAWDVDLMSISAHKMYGPKGVGGLYMRGGPTRVPISPLFFGGGQEWGERPGTLNVPGIVGFGVACSLSRELLAEETTRIARMRDHLESMLVAVLDGLRCNGSQRRRLPGNSNLTFPLIDAEALIANLEDIVISTGSACTAGALEPSHVLLAIGLTREEAYATVRIGLGRFTTEADVEYAFKDIFKAFSVVSEKMKDTHQDR